jgi:hypothetical protein
MVTPNSNQPGTWRIIDCLVLARTIWYLRSSVRSSVCREQKDHPTVESDLLKLRMFQFRRQALLTVEATMSADNRLGSTITVSIPSTV